MALTLGEAEMFGNGEAPDPADPADLPYADPPHADQATDYARWFIEPAGLEVRMNLGVIHGIRRDIFEHPEESARGFLLGRRQQEEHEILWIERFRRHEDPVNGIDDESDTTILALYSGSVTRSTPERLEIFGQPPPGLAMTVQPDASGLLAARFFILAATGALEPGPVFPFHAPGRARRLVPDFDAAGEPRATARQTALPENAQPSRFRLKDFGRIARKAFPYLAGLGILGAAVWLTTRFQTESPAAKPVTGIALRPLGLYVDPAPPVWHVSWNRDATVLQSARELKLFVQDGDDRSQVDLTPRDLASGTWDYRPPAAPGVHRDVTFRLEAIDKTGAPAAESFRLVEERPQTPPTRGTARPATPAKQPATSHSISTQPRAINKIAPVVPAGIRPRIRGKIAVNVRVQIDAHGRVTAAAPVSKPRGDVEILLANRAVDAARAWRFAPATRAGKPTPGAQTIHFVFER